VQELIAAARKNPGGLNYTTSGNGSAPHLGAVHFSRVAGIEMTHIPFKGGAPAIQSVVAGETQLTFGTPPSVLPMVKAGRLRALAVTSLNRSPLVPDVAGMSEAGLPAYSMSFWYGIFVPAATPPEIVKKIFEATQEVMQRPEVKASLAREGTEVALSQSPDDFAGFLVEDNKFWARLVKDAGVKLE
jgi:tripartite-type tricarboxylate transporter receptor subunit TctC